MGYTGYENYQRVINLLKLFQLPLVKEYFSLCKTDREIKVR